MLDLIIITCLPVMDLIIGLIMLPMNLPLAEIDRIEDTTNELHSICLDFAADEIKKAIMKIIILRSCKTAC